MRLSEVGRREDENHIRRATGSIEAVPIIGRGVLQDAVKHTREGFKSTIGDCIAEGIVARPETELLDRSGRRIITR